MKDTWYLHAGMCIHAVQPTIYISVKLTDNKLFNMAATVGFLS